MDLSAISEVWHALKTHIYLQEQEAAADTLVNVLVDSGHSLSDIKEAFSLDRDVLTSLKQFFDDDDVVEERFDEPMYDEDEDDWN